eukprot:SAG31_NODE_6109_length_2167_cov_3.984526_2_plen_251_part_00
MSRKNGKQPLQARSAQAVGHYSLQLSSSALAVGLKRQRSLILPPCQAQLSLILPPCQAQRARAVGPCRVWGTSSAPAVGPRHRRPLLQLRLVRLVRLVRLERLRSRPACQAQRARAVGPCRVWGTSSAPAAGPRHRRPLLQLRLVRLVRLQQPHYIQVSRQDMYYQFLLDPLVRLERLRGRPACQAQRARAVGPCRVWGTSSAPAVGPRQRALSSFKEKRKSIGNEQRRPRRHICRMLKSVVLLFRILHW